MSKAVKLMTSGEAEIIDVPKRVRFDWYPKAIGCNLFEIVRPSLLPEGYILIVDEGGKLIDSPVINFIGSWLYGTDRHGEPICGDCVIMKEQMTKRGMDIVGLTMEEAVTFRDSAYETLPLAVRLIRNRMGKKLVEKKY